ncbi:MAG: hypothetical protein M5U28_33710 [Sandaracinaceae bacterium]|nr:hypothetical protein [Sandaracinaceae bacterium]
MVKARSTVEAEVATSAVRSVSSMTRTTCVAGRASSRGSTGLFRATKPIVQLLSRSTPGATPSIACMHTVSPQSADGRSTACSAKNPTGSMVSGLGTSPRETIERK